MPNVIYVATNREVNSSARGFAKFGKEVNRRGGNELRFARIEKVGRKYAIEILKEPEREGMRNGSVRPPSKRVADELFKALTRAPKSGPQRRDLVFFVHGFNNDMEAVVERAFEMRRLYKVEVLAFSWPADGGGLKGVVSYKSDKRDARASAGALDRVLEKLSENLHAFRKDRLSELRTELTLRHPDNPERVEEMLTRKALRDCPFRISLLCHSMGNYLFKNLLQSSIYNGRKLIFDNVVLAAADTNNPGHQEWINLIQARNRVYVTINEDDSALKVSRIKGGDEQLARLGHYPYNLHSRQTVYVDFTNASKVGDSHAYFEGKPIKNVRVRRFFQRALHGLSAESSQNYDAARNLYTP